MAKEAVEGVDIGGKNTVFGLVDRSGKVLADGKFATTDYPKVENFVSALQRWVKELTIREQGLQITVAGMGTSIANYNIGTIRMLALGNACLQGSSRKSSFLNSGKQSSFAWGSRTRT